MKSRIWIALPLAAALMTPAVAQQDTGNQPASQEQPAATQQQPAASTQNQAAQDQYGARQPLKADLHQGFWGKLNPFARKKYVQRQMGPIRDRVNELDELTAVNSKEIRDVDARAQEGIRNAAARANEADQHAVAAGSAAQQANQTAQQASTRLVTVQQVVSNIDQYQPATQVEIRMRPGQVMLTKKAKEALDQVADAVKGQNGYIFEVQGFSSGRGEQAVENSERMAQAVVRYLVIDHDIPVYRIYLLGRGNAPVQATAEGTKAKRTVRGGRVEVSLLKNGVEQLASANAPAPAAETTSGQGGVSGTTTQPAPQAPATQQPSNAPNTQQPAAAPAQSSQAPPPAQQ